MSGRNKKQSSNNARRKHAPSPLRPFPLLPPEITTHVIRMVKDRRTLINLSQSGPVLAALSRHSRLSVLNLPSQDACFAYIAFCKQVPDAPGLVRKLKLEGDEYSSFDLEDPAIILQALAQVIHLESIHLTDGGWGEILEVLPLGRVHSLYLGNGAVIGLEQCFRLMPLLRNLTLESYGHNPDAKSTLLSPLGDAPIPSLETLELRSYRDQQFITSVTSHAFPFCVRNLRCLYITQPNYKAESMISQLIEASEVKMEEMVIAKPSECFGQDGGDQYFSEEEDEEDFPDEESEEDLSDDEDCSDKEDDEDFSDQENHGPTGVAALRLAIKPSKQPTPTIRGPMLKLLCLDMTDHNPDEDADEEHDPTSCLYWLLQYLRKCGPSRFIDTLCLDIRLKDSESIEACKSSEVWKHLDAELAKSPDSRGLPCLEIRMKGFVSKDAEMEGEGGMVAGMYKSGFRDLVECVKKKMPILHAVGNLVFHDAAVKRPHSQAPAQHFAKMTKQDWMRMYDF